MLGAIRALRTDTVVVTHFLAINAVVGAATDDDRVVGFAPAHCSRTVVDLDDDGGLRLVELGDTGAPTRRSDAAARVRHRDRNPVLRSRGPTR